MGGRSVFKVLFSGPDDKGNNETVVNFVLAPDWGKCTAVMDKDPILQKEGWKLAQVTIICPIDMEIPS